MSRYDVDVIVASAKKKKKKWTVNVLLDEAQHLDVTGLFVQYEAQGLPHSGLCDAMFPTETMY